MDKKFAEILDKLWIYILSGEQHEKENKENGLIDRGIVYFEPCRVRLWKDGQLTVVESVTEKADNGGDIIVSPGSGDDSEFNKVTVTYDENTLFAIQTIYDGGARAEMSAATAADLAAGQHIQVWGSSSGSGLKATQICIVKVA